jgi:hypothetical protein
MPMTVMPAEPADVEVSAEGLRLEVSESPTYLWLNRVVESPDATPAPDGSITEDSATPLTDAELPTHGGHSAAMASEKSKGCLSSTTDLGAPYPLLLVFVGHLLFCRRRRERE